MTLSSELALATPQDDRRWGKHRGRFYLPDLVLLQHDGDISAAEAKAMSEWFTPHVDGKDARFLIDIRRLGNLPPDARKELAMQRAVPKEDRDYFVDLVFIGATLRTKVLMSVVVAAATITSNVRLRNLYFPSFREAVAWAKLAIAE